MAKSIHECLKEPYARILIPEEDGGYSAEILEFPGCFAQGETADDTMQALDRAAESWMQAALEQGQEIPAPCLNQGYSGKIALRLPRSLHRQAVHFAARDGVSLNQFLASAVAARVGAEELYTRLATHLLQMLEERVSAVFTRAPQSTSVNLRIDFAHLVTASSQQKQPTLLHAPISHEIVATSIPRDEALHG